MPPAIIKPRADAPNSGAGTGRPGFDFASESSAKLTPIPVAESIVARPSAIAAFFIIQALQKPNQTLTHSRRRRKCKKYLFLAPDPFIGVLETEFAALRRLRRLEARAVGNWQWRIGAVEELD